MLTAVGPGRVAFLAVPGSSSEPERVRLRVRHPRAAELAGCLARRHHGLAGRAANRLGTGCRPALAVDVSISSIQLTDTGCEVGDGETETLGQEFPHRLGHQSEPPDAIMHLRIERMAPTRGTLGLRLATRLPGLQVLDLHLLHDVPDAHA